jgi:hypothetical protein
LLFDTTNRPIHLEAGKVDRPVVYQSLGSAVNGEGVVGIEEAGPGRRGPGVEYRRSPVVWWCLLLDMLGKQCSLGRQPVGQQ